jgi:hypothetical protein
MGRIALVLWGLVVGAIFLAMIASYALPSGVTYQSEFFRIADHGTTQMMFGTVDGELGIRYVHTWARHIPAYLAVLTDRQMKETAEQSWRRTNPYIAMGRTRGPVQNFSWKSVHSGSQPAGVINTDVLLSAPWLFLLAVVCVPWVGVLLLRAQAAHRIHVRRKKGHCIHCGYDLRASPDRCPECGAGVTGTTP